MATVLIDGFDGPPEVEMIAPAIELAGRLLTICWPSPVVVRHADGRLIGRVPAGEVRHWQFNEAGDEAVEVVYGDPG